MVKLIKTILFLSLLSTLSFAENWDFLSVNGYGTVGAVYQGNDKILYRDTFHTDKGSQGDLSFDNYTILGLQLDTKITDNLNFFLQTTMSPTNENERIIDIEWANLKYQISDTFDMRMGIMRIPAYFYSDVFHVAYAYDWIRLPDMYSIVPFYKYNGVEFSHNFNLNDLFISSTFAYGEANSNGKFVRDDNQLSQTKISVDNMSLISLKLLYNNLTFKVSYSQEKITFDDPTSTTILSQLNTLNIPIISDTIKKKELDKQPVSYFNIGARYEFPQSYIMGEYMKINSDSFIPDIYSWYVGAGYKFESWSPYVVYSRAQEDSNYQPLSSEGMPTTVIPFISIANQAFSIMSTLPEIDKKTLSFGLRYDLSENVLLKFQYENQDRLGSTLNVYNTAINFVF